jgi:hypothetical protein
LHKAVYLLDIGEKGVGNRVSRIEH